VDKALFVCDLHTHTNRSDGNDTCRELVDFAALAGIEILALTDHDIIAPKTIEIEDGVIALVDYAKSKNITLLPGIEFSCDTMVEDVHIVALGCDYSAPFFDIEYQNSIRSKIDGYHELCDILTGDGLAVDWQRDILLDGQRDENAVQRKHVFEAMALKGYVKEWSDAKLLIQNTDKYEVRRKKPDPVGIINNIHEAGGIAILAHPYLIAETPLLNGEKIPRARYIDYLIEAGLDGIEVSYPYHKTSYGGSLPTELIEEEVRRLYAGRVAILSGGSDYHNEGKKGSKKARLLGECGVTMEYFTANPLLRALLS